MKINRKKSASQEDETVLVQLERRHTLKEDAHETDLDDNPRKTIRANSVGSFGGGHPSGDVEAVAAEKPSSLARRPTVITESELSSSWLYKDRKAKINSDDESIEESKPTTQCENQEDLEPRMLQDPKMKPTPVSIQRSRKMSSCCWYFTIILVIFIACLAVMAGVGGIVYMEYFASHKNKDMENNDTSVKNDNLLASKEIFQHPSHKQDNVHRNEPSIPEKVLKDLIKNIPTSQPRLEAFHNKVTNLNSGKTEDLHKTQSNFISKNQATEVTEHPEIAELLDASRNILSSINNFIVPVSDESVRIKSETKDENLLDLKLNSQNVDVKPDEHVYEVNEQKPRNESITKISNSGTEVSNSSEETLASGRNFNFDEMTTLQSIGLKGEQISEDTPFQTLPKQNRIEHSIHLLPNGNSVDHIEGSNNDKRKDNSFDFEKYDVETESINDAKHSINQKAISNSSDHTDLPINHESKNNSVGNSEHSISNESKDNSLNLTEHFIDQNPKNNSLHQIDISSDPNVKSFNDHSKDSSEFDSADRSSTEHSLVDDHNQNSDDSAQLVFLQPVVDSKAIPIPLAFLRRIGFDIKNPNSHQPMTAKDMDIKFSLAEALKYLRSLDTDRKLPMSREKTTTHKTRKHEDSKKMNLTEKLEREEYLNRLRKQIFVESL